MDLQIIVLAVMALMIVLLLSRKASLGWIGLLIPCIFTITGITTSKEALQGLTDKSMFIFIGAFVLSEAFFQVGLADRLGKWIQNKLCRVKSESLILLILCLFTAAMSSVLSSLGVQVAVLALILAVGDHIKVSKTKLMMAIGYSATIGGTMTLIGTPLNLVGKAAYENAVAGGTIGMFDISLVTIPAGLLMIFYFCFIGSRFLPNRRQMEGGNGDFEKNRGTRKNQIIITVLFIVFIVLIAMDGMSHIPPSNIIGIFVVLIIGAAKILNVKEMVNCIRWDVLVFIMGIQSLGVAIKNVGMDELLSEKISVLFSQEIPERLLIAAVFLLVAIITQFLNNSGTFGVVLPFVLMLASSLKVDLKPVMMTAMMAASCGFILPLAAPTYPMLAEEGDIHLRDWLVQGLPLVLIAFVACVVLVPIYWPI